MKIKLDQAIMKLINNISKSNFNNLIITINNLINNL